VRHEVTFFLLLLLVIESPKILKSFPFLPFTEAWIETPHPTFRIFRSTVLVVFLFLIRFVSTFLYHLLTLKKLPYAISHSCLFFNYCDLHFPNVSRLNSTSHQTQTIVETTPNQIGCSMVRGSPPLPPSLHRVYVPPSIHDDPCRSPTLILYSPPRRRLFV